MDIQDNSTELETVEVKGQDDADMTDREIALETLRLTRETHAAMKGTQEMVAGVIAEVGPMIESFANNPMLKTFGFGKKFGK